MPCFYCLLLNLYKTIVYRHLIIVYRNKYFWLTIVPALFLLVGQVLRALGIDYDTDAVSSAVVDSINAIFALLSAFGVVVDMTTQGIGDSERALTYDKPN